MTVVQAPLQVIELQRGKRQLPAEFVAALDSWVDAGQSVEEFFELNKAELGEAAAYDLRRWGVGGKKAVPAYVRDALDAGRLEVGDLDSPAGHELLDGGKPAEYDLSYWQ